MRLHWRMPIPNFVKTCQVPLEASLNTQGRTARQADIQVDRQTGKQAHAYPTITTPKYNTNVLCFGGRGRHKKGISKEQDHSIRKNKVHQNNSYNSSNNKNCKFETVSVIRLNVLYIQTNSQQKDRHTRGKTGKENSQSINQAIHDY